MSDESDAKDTFFSCHFLITALYLLSERCEDGNHHDKLQNMKDASDRDKIGEFSQHEQGHRYNNIFRRIRNATTDVVIFNTKASIILLENFGKFTMGDFGRSNLPLHDSAHFFTFC